MTTLNSPLTGNGWPKLHKVLLAIVLFIMVIHTLIYVTFGAALIPFPFDYDQAEGFELNNAILLSQGECPYCDNETFPFYASGYPPLFHIVMVPFVWLFGPNFWYGRLIIFASTLVTAGAIAYAVRREEKQTLIALIAGMAFLASNYIYHIGPLLRQHLLMVMLETLAVVVVAKAFDTGNTKHRRNLIITSIILLLLAGYTKQLAVSTCIAVFIWLFLRNPRATILYSIGPILVAAGIFVVFYAATDGLWWLNIVTSNQNEYISQQFVGLAVQFARLHWPLLIMAGLMVVYELYFSKLSVYTIWFVASLVSTFGAGKWGAGDSYFATTIAAACLLTGIFIARSLNKQWRFPDNYISCTIERINGNLSRHSISLQNISAGVGLVLLIVYGLTVVKLPTSGPIFGPISETLGISPAPGHRYPLYDAAGWTVGYAVTGHFPSDEDVQNGWKIVEAVENTDGLVMSEDAGFVIQAGREVITNGVQLHNLWELDKIDLTNLMDYIENQQFGLIILRANILPEPVLVAISTYYEAEESIPMNGFNYELWRPKT